MALKDWRRVINADKVKNNAIKFATQYMRKH